MGSRNQPHNGGVYQRHRTSCTEPENCDCPFVGWVYDKHRRYLDHQGIERVGSKIRTTHNTEIEAEIWRAKQLERLAAERAHGPANMTLAEHFADWREDAAAGVIDSRHHARYEPSTIRGYSYVFERLIAPRLGAERVENLTGERIADFNRSLRRSGVKDGERGNVTSIMRTLFWYAIHRRRLSDAPWHELRVARGMSSKEHNVADPRIIPEVLARLGRQDRAIEAVALFAGLRRSELQALEWRDVDFAASRITVRRKYDHIHHVFSLPKGRKARVVPLIPQLASELERYAGQGGQLTGRVFSSRRGTPFSVTATARHIRAAWQASGVRPLSFRDCRHTFASIAIAAGVNIKDLQLFMGHRSITTTIDTYGHQLPGGEVFAAEAMGAFLGAAFAGRSPTESVGRNAWRESWRARWRRGT